MRVAVSGAHGTGKTTLVESLANELPDHVMIEEPYYQLENEGHVFPITLGLRDFELQFARSVQSILSSGKNTIFDRCPADFIAYMLCHRGAASIEIDAWISRAREAMGMLNHVVYLPIEHPDRIVMPRSEQIALRKKVDESLRDILVEDMYGLGVKPIEVTGPVKQRVAEVLRHAK